jgi:preprotein translocase subunit YajC
MRMNLAEITFMSILVIMVAFYLITIRPAQQEQKRQRIGPR